MNIARTGLLLAAMTALFLVVGYLLGGRSGAMIALAIALGTNLFAWWSSDKMVLRMHNARPVTRASRAGALRAGGRSWRSARSCRCRRST